MIGASEGACVRDGGESFVLVKGRGEGGLKHGEELRVRGRDRVGVGGLAGGVGGVIDSENIRWEKILTCRAATSVIHALYLLHLKCGNDKMLSVAL